MALWNILMLFTCFMHLISVCNGQHEQLPCMYESVPCGIHFSLTLLLFPDVAWMRCWDIFSGLDNSKRIDTPCILSCLLLHCNNLVAVIRINYQSTLYVCVFPAAKHFINGWAQRIVVYGLLGQYIGFKLTSIVTYCVFTVMGLGYFSDTLAAVPTTGEIRLR